MKNKRGMFIEEDFPRKVLEANIIETLKPGKTIQLATPKVQFPPELAFAKKLVCTDGLAKQEWLKYRQMGVGGSDVASICGINKFSSALACYYDKTEKIQELEAENLPAELGLFLEPFIATKFEKWFKENEGLDINAYKIPYILQHPTNKIALANLDGAFIHPETKEEIIVEYKTTSAFNYLQWKDENLPSEYYLQIQHYLYVTNLKKCYLAFLIGNNKFNVTLIERNDEVIEQLIVKINYFWNTFILPKVAPAPSGDESSKNILDKMYEATTGKEIVLEDKFLTSIKIINDLKKKVSEMTKDIELNKQLIKAEMKDAEIAKCRDFLITWKEILKKEYLVKASTYRKLQIKKVI